MYKVLFVDDEPWAIIDIIHSISWNEQGFYILGHYENPQEAIEAILALQPDLVFTDIMMPGLDGFEVIRRCREQGSESQFIILSGHSDFDFAKKAIRAAVLDYCLKPVNPKAIVRLLDEIKPLLEDKRVEKQEVVLPIEIPAATEEDRSDQFETILQYIRENYGSKLVLTQLAQRFSFNKNYICHLFKKHTNNTFTSYLTQIRIQAAKQLLADTSISQSDIAAQTGFMDYYYFNKVFKAECGQTPYQYRKSLQQSKEAPHG